MINKEHERELRVVLNEHTSDFETLLQKNNGLCDHHTNIQALLIEIFKAKNALAPPIMRSMFKKRNTTYNVRNSQEFETKRKITICCGLETLIYRSPQLWNFCQNS